MKPSEQLQMWFEAGANAIGVAHIPIADIAEVQRELVQLEADLVGFEKDNADIHGEVENYRKALEQAIQSLEKRDKRDHKAVEFRVQGPVPYVEADDIVRAKKALSE